MKVTVKELIRVLKQCDPDALVIMASDEEGNTHSPLHEVTSFHYAEDWEPCEDTTLPKGVFFYPTY